MSAEFLVSSVAGASFVGMLVAGHRFFSARAIIGSIYGGGGSTPDVPRRMHELTKRIDNLGGISFPGFERFEAWTQCPSCDRIAVHPMREPEAMNPGKRWELERELGHVLTQRQSEYRYDVIRICECGQEWGQR